MCIFKNIESIWELLSTDIIIFKRKKTILKWMKIFGYRTTIIINYPFMYNSIRVVGDKVTKEKFLELWKIERKKYNESFIKRDFEFINLLKNEEIEKKKERQENLIKKFKEADVAIKEYYNKINKSNFEALRKPFKKAEDWARIYEEWSISGCNISYKKVNPLAGLDKNKIDNRSYGIIYSSDPHKITADDLFNNKIKNKTMSQKKYKLLKDLPECNAGQEFTKDRSGTLLLPILNDENIKYRWEIAMRIKDIINFKEWFEEIKEEKLQATMKIISTKKLSSDNPFSIEVAEMGESNGDLGHKFFYEVKITHAK